VWDFVRSPTFYAETAYADASGSGKRPAYATEYWPPETADATENGGYAVVLDSLTPLNNGAFDTVSVKRLGVPVPGSLGEGNAVKQSGAITAIRLFSTTNDTDVYAPQAQVVTSEAHGMKTGTKVLIDYTGIAPGPWTITATTSPTIFHLQKTDLKVKNCTLRFYKEATNSTTCQARFNSSNHGLKDADQILV